MKKLLLITMIFIAGKCTAQNTKLTKLDSTNIKHLQDAIVFVEPLKTSFDGMIFCWYAIERRKVDSKTAFLNTLNKMSAELRKIANQ